MSQTDRYYPELDEKNIGLVARIARTDPGYFVDARCPYTRAVKDAFTATVVRPENSEGIDDADLEQPTTAELSKRIMRLVKELDIFGKTEGQSSADKNTYFRLSVGLVKDLVAMQEKVSLLDQHEAFVNEVLSIFADVCDADQRAVCRERLEKFVGADNNVKEPEQV